MQLRVVCVMRLKDEEKKIKRCLDAMPFVDRFIVVLNDSTDRTENIVSQYPSTILHTEGLDASRDLNLAYAEARRLEAEWVLFVDGDEEFENKAKDHLHELLLPGPINGWIMRIYPFVLSKEFWRVDRDWAQFTMKGQLRLFRVQDGIYWSDPRPTHPGLPQGLKGAIRPSDLRIKHYTIETQEELERKLAFYARDTSTAHFRNDENAVFKRWIE